MNAAQSTAPQAAVPQRYAHFTGRAFAVFGVSLTFPVLLLSGIILYIAPAGRVANQSGWQILWLDRGGWEMLHATAAVLFLGLVAWHVLVHLPVYRSLLGGTPAHPGGHRREALLALGIAVLVVLLVALGWPPASWLEDGSRYFRQEHWTTSASAPGQWRGRAH